MSGLRLLHRCGAALVIAPLLAACGGDASRSDAMAADPAIASATATCEQKLAALQLSNYEQVAQCERDAVLPRVEKTEPELSNLYKAIWDDKIKLYRQVDSGALSKAEADWQQAIDAQNMTNIVRSLRRY
jgi:hypothetical protein